MARSPKAPPVFDRIGKTLGAHKTLNRGLIAFRLSGTGGGDYVIDSSRGGLIESSEAATQQTRVEIMGDARRIQAILEGKKDPRKQFLAGGIRVRGDLRYLSDALLELGILTEPL